jgi:aspartate racemase
MKHIGILAHSADGAALCFLEMCREGTRQLGAHMHPEITMSIQPMGEVLDAWGCMDITRLNTFFARTARHLLDAGCDFFVCPDNTAHIAFEAPGVRLPLPALHIADIVAERAAREGRRCIGLLGTKWTMEGPVYPEAFARRGIAQLVPPPEDRALVDRIIFDELCNGELNDESRREYLRIIAALKDNGCDATALSCTEIPLLVTPDVSPLPVLDSTRLLAHEAVAVALERRPLPAWRGGPLS